MLNREQVLNVYPKLLAQMISKRFIAKTSQYPRPESKHYRLWAVPGDLVNRKDILAKQYTMKWHPGLNVGIQEDRALYALKDGVMIITEEKFNPDWSHPLVKKAYTNDKNEELAPNMMRYIHVIPKKKISEFKLIDVI